MAENHNWLTSLNQHLQYSISTGGSAMGCMRKSMYGHKPTRLCYETVWLKIGAWQLFMQVFHTEFASNMYSGLWDTWNTRFIN